MGRWHVADAMTESHFESTPYHYCFNNPIRFIDPFGNDTTDTGDMIGADGLTNSQWIEASRPGASKAIKDKYQQQNEGQVMNRYNEKEYINNLFVSAYYGKTDVLEKSGLYGYYTSSRGVIHKVVIYGFNYSPPQGFFEDGIWTVGFTGTLAVGVIGGSFEVGGTLDFRDGFRLGGYGTLEAAAGIDASLGGIVNYHKPKEWVKNFGISDLNGWGESYNAAGWIFDVTYRGNSLYTGLNWKNYSNQHPTYDTYGFGVSGGLPIGYTQNKGGTCTTKTIKVW